MPSCAEMAFSLSIYYTVCSVFEFQAPGSPPTAASKGPKNVGLSCFMSLDPIEG